MPRAAIDQHALRNGLRNNKMADMGWKDFQAEMKRKRVGKCTGKGKDDKSCRDELTVQRLSSEVAAKQRKYTRIDPREFVDFSGRELTICDILAGEKGPSCGKVKQIPNTILIHVRFIDETEVEIEGKCDDTQSDSEDTGRKKTLKRNQGNAASVSKVTQSVPSQVKREKWKTPNRELFPRASPYQPYSPWVVLLNLALPWLT